MRRVMIPVAPGVLCADGLLAADIRAEFSRTLPKAGPIDVAASEAIFADLAREADAWLAEERVAPTRRQVGRTALMRYRGQGGEVAVPWAGDAAGLEATFAATHQALYGFTLDAPIECVTLRVEAAGKVAQPPTALVPPGTGARPVATAKAALGDRTAPEDVPLYDRAALGAGDRFSGPAIVTQLDATTLVPPGWTVTVHASGALLMETGA
jgi:N-methylhydantoinase A